MLVSGMASTVDNSTLSSYSKQDSTNPTAVVTSSTEAALKKTSTLATSSEVKQASKQPSNANASVGGLNANVETEVREYFADIPLMAEVSKCESRFRQFENDGSVFRGKINDRDVGAMQINEFYHAERAKKLGYNLHTLKGNMDYARLLYKEQGAQPWVSSSPCWKKSEVAKAVYGHEAVSTSESMKVALIEDFRDAQKNIIAMRSSGSSKVLADNI
ncbi:MAG: hypothetical protein K9M11_00985 [Candidatus Pacebacteria bacterium]|nr:hypothetical protein [Candidatus Paceibacterota bacterium]